MSNTFQGVDVEQLDNAMESISDDLADMAIAFINSDATHVRQLAAVNINGQSGSDQDIMTFTALTRITDVFWEYISGAALTLAVARCGVNAGTNNVVSAQALVGLANSNLSLASSLVAPRSLCAIGQTLKATMTTPALGASVIRVMIYGVGG